jgi:ribosomal protein S18 acetylase RimI-like enzyme
LGGNPMEMTIRKALPEDAYDYADCHISCFQTAYKGIVSDEYLINMLAEKEKLVEKYKKSLTDPGDCEYYCVIYAERMIGFLIINKSLSEDKSGIGEIWAIYLIKEFRGIGYGKQMLSFALNELKQQKEIFLWVFEDNKRARRFYEKSSFCFDGIKREVNYGKPLVQLRYVFDSAK